MLTSLPLVAGQPAGQSFSAPVARPCLIEAMRKKKATKHHEHSRPKKVRVPEYLQEGTWHVGGDGLCSDGNGRKWHARTYGTLLCQQSNVQVHLHP